MKLALEFEKVSKVYSNGVLALNQFSFQLPEGSFYALLGLNGAGKSTAIRLLSMLTPLTSGRIQAFEATDIYRSPLSVRRWLGIMPQEANLNLFQTVEETLVMQGGLYGLSHSVTIKRAKALLEALHLSHKWRSSVKSLSGGMKRRLLLVRALLSQPRLLVLDEPTAGLDIEVRRATWDLIQQIHRSGTTILLTTHYLEEVEQLCSHCIILKKGEAMFNGSLEMLTKTFEKVAWKIAVDRPLAEVTLQKIGNVIALDSHHLKFYATQKEDLSRVLELLLAESYKITECGLLETSLESVLSP